MLRQTRYVRDSVADERLGCVHSDESGSVRGEDCPIRQGFLLGRGNTVRLGHVRPLPGPRAHIQPLLSAAILTIPVTMTNAAQRPSNVHIKIPLGLRQLMAWSRIGRVIENIAELVSETRLARAPGVWGRRILYSWRLFS